MDNKKLIIIVIAILAAGCIIGSILYIGPTYEDTNETNNNTTRSEFVINYYAESNTWTLEELTGEENLNQITANWIYSLKDNYSIVTGFKNNAELRLIEQYFDSYDDSIPTTLYLVKTADLNKINLHSNDYLFINGSISETRKLTDTVTVSVIDDVDII